MWTLICFLRQKTATVRLFRSLRRNTVRLSGAAVEKYRRMCGESTDDLHQEALLAFYRAVKTYDTEKKGVTFGLYAKICINNRMISILRRAGAENRRKAAASLMKTSARTTDRYFPELDGVSEMMDRLLTKYEKKVLIMYIEGKSYKDIALTLGRNEKSVDNALFRARSKLRSGYHM